MNNLSNLSFEDRRVIKQISYNNDVPESWAKQQMIKMKEYIADGAIHGNNLQGYLKWSQKQSVK